MTRDIQKNFSPIDFSLRSRKHNTATVYVFNVTNICSAHDNVSLSNCICKCIQCDIHINTFGRGRTSINFRDYSCMAISALLPNAGWPHVFVDHTDDSIMARRIAARTCTKNEACYMNIIFLYTYIHYVLYDV